MRHFILIKERCMKIYLRLYLSFFSIGFSPLCFADPFYSSATSAETTAIEMAKEERKIPACQLPDKLAPISLSTAFNKLHFIGTVVLKQRTKALFIDEDKHLIDLAVNDLLQPDFIQITEIDFKYIKYIDWLKNTNCFQPTEIMLKL